MQIHELPASTSVASTDVFVKETSGGVTQKITASYFVVNDLTSTETYKPLSANQGKVLNDKIVNKTTYHTLIDRETITQAYATYSTYNSRKLSDYSMLVIAPDFGGWYCNSCILPTSVFQGASGAVVTMLDGSSNLEVDVKYVSDTSFSIKYIGTTQSAVHVRIYGIF